MYVIVLRISVKPPCAVYLSAVTSIYSRAARALSVWRFQQGDVPRIHIQSTVCVLLKHKIDY